VGQYYSGGDILVNAFIKGTHLELMKSFPTMRRSTKSLQLRQ